MTRIAPADLATVPATTRDQLAAVQRSLGVLPNLFTTVARSPAALDGLLALQGATARGTLPGRIRHAIALAVAEVDGCDYCLSAHAVLGKGAGLADDEIAAARRGGGRDPRVAAAAKFARDLTIRRGDASDTDLAAIRHAGFDDAQILEIVANIALNVFTNFANKVAQTAIDFPVLHHEAA